MLVYIVLLNSVANINLLTSIGAQTASFQMCEQEVEL